MTCNLINRCTAGALTAAVVLGAAGPAAAQPILDPHGPVFPPQHTAHYQKANVLPWYSGTTVPYYGKANVLPPYMPKPAVAPAATATPRAAVNRPATGGGSDLAYVIVGGVVFAIGGLGGAFAAGRKRGTRAAQPSSTIAA
jgi:hypothetical protein